MPAVTSPPPLLKIITDSIATTIPPTNRLTFIPSENLFIEEAMSIEFIVQRNAESPPLSKIAAINLINKIVWPTIESAIKSALLGVDDTFVKRVINKVLKEVVQIKKMLR